MADYSYRIGSFGGAVPGRLRVSCRYPDLSPHQLEALPRVGLPALGDSPREDRRTFVLCSAPSSPSSPGSSNMSCDGDSNSSWGYIPAGLAGGQVGQGTLCSDGKARLWTRRLREKPLMSIVTLGEAGPPQHLGVVRMVQPS